jgi:anti-sigma factor RsiW
MRPDELPPDCEWALKVLFEARCGQAAPETAERLRAHLEACPRCRQAQAWDERLSEALGKARLPPTPSGLEQRVRRWVGRRRTLRQASLATAAATLVAVGVLLWRLGSGVPPTPELVQRPAPRAVEDDLRDAVFLISSPPVDRLEVLGRQQAAYVRVLEQFEREY